MSNKNKHIAPKIRKYLTIFLSLQFILSYTLAYSHLNDKECCHSNKSEDSCCMMDNMKSSNCSMEDMELGISHCGCNHDKDAIDQFIVSEKTLTTDATITLIPQIDLDADEGHCQDFNYELKILPSEIPKYISNASFLI